MKLKTKTLKQLVRLHSKGRKDKSFIFRMVDNTDPMFPVIEQEKVMFDEIDEFPAEYCFTELCEEEGLMWYALFGWPTYFEEGRLNTTIQVGF